MNSNANMERLHALLLQIPPGKVTTYKAIAHAMGTKGYRFVGQLLNKNPHPEQFPCYKVVNADGRLGGFALGDTEKIRRLKADGIEVKQGKIVGFKERFFEF